MSSITFNTSVTDLINELVFCRYYVDFSSKVPRINKGQNYNDDYIPSFQLQNFRQFYLERSDDESKPQLFDRKSMNLIFCDLLVTNIMLFCSGPRRNGFSNDTIKKYLAKSAARISFFDSSVTLNVDEARFVQAVCNYSGSIYDDRVHKLGHLEKDFCKLNGDVININGDE